MLTTVSKALFVGHPHAEEIEVPLGEDKRTYRSISTSLRNPGVSSR